MPDSVWQKTGGILMGSFSETSNHRPLATLASFPCQHRSPKLLSLSDHTARPSFLYLSHVFLLGRTTTSLHLQQLSDSCPYLFLVERPSIASITTLSTYIIRYATNPTSSTRNGLRYPFLFSRFPILSHSGREGQ